MKKLILSVVICLPLLAGCSVFDFFKKEEISVSSKAIEINPKLLQSCDLLKKTVLKTPDDALLENIELYKMYGICARKQEDSIKALKQISAPK